MAGHWAGLPLYENPPRENPAVHHMRNARGSSPQKVANRGIWASCSFLSRFFGQPVQNLPGLAGANCQNSRRKLHLLFMDPAARQIRRQGRVTEYGCRWVCPASPPESPQPGFWPTGIPKSTGSHPRPVKTGQILNKHRKNPGTFLTGSLTRC